MPAKEAIRTMKMIERRRLFILSGSKGIFVTDIRRVNNCHILLVYYSVTGQRWRVKTIILLSDLLRLTKTKSQRNVPGYIIVYDVYIKYQGEEVKLRKEAKKNFVYMCYCNPKVAKSCTNVPSYIQAGYEVKFSK
jgi:hypothetical protein